MKKKIKLDPIPEPKIRKQLPSHLVVTKVHKQKTKKNKSKFRVSGDPKNIDADDDKFYE